MREWPISGQEFSFNSFSSLLEIKQFFLFCFLFQRSFITSFLSLADHPHPSPSLLLFLFGNHHQLTFSLGTDHHRLCAFRFLTIYVKLSPASLVPPPFLHCEKRLSPMSSISDSGGLPCNIIFAPLSFPSFGCRWLSVLPCICQRPFFLLPAFDRLLLL